MAGPLGFEGGSLKRDRASPRCSSLFALPQTSTIPFLLSKGLLGARKTFAGARMICELVRRGAPRRRRVNLTRLPDSLAIAFLEGFVRGLAIEGASVTG